MVPNSVKPTNWKSLANLKIDKMQRNPCPDICHNQTAEKYINIVSSQRKMTLLIRAWCEWL